LRDRKAGAISDDEAIQRLKRSPSWVWTAMDPTSKLLVVVDVGSRTLAMAQRVVHQVTQVLAPDCVPLFFTDGLKDYTTALLTHFGHWMHPARRQDKGPMPKPRWMPLPQLCYAQVVKSYRRRRMVGVTHRVVFGTRLAIEQLLAACGWTMNTAFVERLNLDIRQCVAAIGRVPDACGYSFEASPKPSASPDSPGYKPAKSVFNPSLAPLGLPLSTPSLSTS
jgi:IS1 family transposase